MLRRVHLLLQRLDDIQPKRRRWGRERHGPLRLARPASAWRTYRRERCPAPQI